MYIRFRLRKWRAIIRLSTHDVRAYALTAEAEVNVQINRSTVHENLLVSSTKGNRLWCNIYERLSLMIILSHVLNCSYTLARLVYFYSYTICL